jgi:organic hydroperoxide reductase OsmC/OhrA
MADEPHLYRTSIRWQESRKAALTAPGLPDWQVATPPEFPGGHAGVWSPEHLFVASAEACLMTTFLAIAENSKLAFTSYSSTAAGKLEKTAEGFMITEIALKARVEIKDPAAADRAKRIVEKAEQACLISKSMKTRILLEVEVIAPGS